MNNTLAPCPFCQNPNAEEAGGACCFCDYEGEVIIGFGGHFKNIEQYYKVYSATNHQDRLDELYDRDNPNKITEL